VCNTSSLLRLFTSRVTRIFFPNNLSAVVDAYKPHTHTSRARHIHRCARACYTMGSRVNQPTFARRSEEKTISKNTTRQRYAAADFVRGGLRKRSPPGVFIDNVPERNPKVSFCRFRPPVLIPYRRVSHTPDVPAFPGHSTVQNGFSPVPLLPRPSTHLLFTPYHPPPFL